MINIPNILLFFLWILFLSYSGLVTLKCLFPPNLDSNYPDYKDNFVFSYLLGHIIASVLVAILSFSQIISTGIFIIAIIGEVEAVPVSL